MNLFAPDELTPQQATHYADEMARLVELPHNAGIQPAIRRLIDALRDRAAQ